MSDNPFRQLPSVAKLLEHPALAAARAEQPHDLVTDAIRLELDSLRRHLKPSSTFDLERLLTNITNRVAELSKPRVRPVINATGIVLHTNLGRSILAEIAAKAAYEAARQYVAIEMDLATGERASRQSPIRDLVCKLTGAESATVVNNCAAATVLTLMALAAGKEVIVSRGQLIEIGGSFRIPDIMATSGATLREVGTTNITRLADYEAAIGANTAALMRVHCSNYRVRGFTESVGIAELATLGKKHNLPVIDDVGSGTAMDLAPLGFNGEPTIRDGLSAGADLVLFSGDKLLGGPQAGLIAGKKQWIDKIEKHPLMRAQRLDKITLAALEATLRLHCDPATVKREVPTLRMLAMTVAELQPRLESLMAKLSGIPCEIRDDVAYAGGGSLPDQSMPTRVLAIQSPSATALAARLRTASPPVVARIQDDRVLIDLRTVLPEQDDALAVVIHRASKRD